MEGLCLTRFLILFLFFVFCHKSQQVNATKPVLELTKGFEAKPDSSINSFQPLLTDPNGNFSFGFLRVNGSLLSLAVTHPNLTDPLWVLNTTGSLTWSHKTKLIFNGSLVIIDPSSRVEWSTHTNGDRLILRNDSNLQVVKLTSSSVEWESFDYPGNTLVENQNFTSAMSLVSSNGLYSMRLGSDFIGLYAKFGSGPNSQQFYYKRSALQAKAKVKDGLGPIHARINPNGYLGMYQTGTIPIDVEAFNSFQKPVNGLLILRLESDGNLRGYLWDGFKWVLNYEAIRETCDLPNPCGSYSLCTPGTGCSCLDNSTLVGECSHHELSDFCQGEKMTGLRRGGVEVPFKELMDHKTTSSLSECEDMCVEDCKCFGSVYNNGSGFCYLVNYPVRTMLGVADPGKMGYFKVGVSVVKKKSRVGLTVGMCVIAVIALVLTVGMVYVGFKIWSREKRDLEDDGGLSPGPYKNLGSDSSFRSVEMSTR